MASASVGEEAPAASASASAAHPTLFQAALDKVPRVKDADGAIVTEAFLDLCELVLPLIESFGAAFSIVRNDISGNIERLRTRARTDPERFRLLFPIVEDEIARNDYAHGSSCAKGLLWLKRAMEFMIGILRRLGDQPDASLSDIVYETYRATLQRFHGFLASSAFSVAFAFVPSRASFLDKLAGGDGRRFDEATAADMAAFTGEFGGLLEEIHAWIVERDLDDPYKV